MSSVYIYTSISVPVSTSISVSLSTSISLSVSRCISAPTHASLSAGLVVASLPAALKELRASDLAALLVGCGFRGRTVLGGLKRGYRAS